MIPRVLVAGIGNVFFGDDGFGVAVAQRLFREPPVPDVVIADYGIRGLHLAYALLAPYELVVVVDAMTRGGKPGTLYLVEPDGIDDDAIPEAHGMSLPAVLATTRAMGGAIPRLLLVGCEPKRLEEGMGLSAPAERALSGAVRMVRDVLARELRRPCREEVDP